MPNPMFPNGLPISHLSPAAKQVAEQLDQSPLIKRSDPNEKADGTISAEEVQAGLAALDNFSPEGQAALQEMAQLLGVGAPGAQPAAKKEWLEREPPPEGLYEARTAFAIGDFVYAQDDTHNMRTSGLLRYDVEHDQWSELPLPDGFSSRVTNVTDGWRHTSMAEAGGQLYMVGGEASRKQVPWAYRFDPGQKQWHRIADVKPRSAVALAGGDDGKLYAFGGTVKKDDPNDPGRAADGGVGAFMRALGGTNQPPARMIRRQIDAPTNFAQVYDPASNSWADLPPLPVARREGKALSAGGKLFVIGGRGEDGKRLNRVDVFDPSTGQWQDPPFRMPTALQNPSVWLEEGKIHVTGGESDGTASRHGCNTVHEVLDPATGEVSDGPTLRAPDHASNVQVVNTGDRLFALGGTALDRDEKPFLYEYAAEDPAPGAVVNNVINTTVNNTVIHDIDITNVFQDITNVTNVTLIDDRDVDVHIHRTDIDVTNVDVTNIDLDLTKIDVDVTVLSAMQNNRQHGFFDPDQGFFLRTKSKGKDLIRCGVDGDDQRQLVGQAAGGAAPAPKNHRGLLLFHPESETLIPFATDAKGQFAVPLPDEVKGRCLIFGMQGDEASGAATIDVP